MAIAGDRREPRDGVAFDKIIDLGALDVGRAVITASESRISFPGPWAGDSLWEILRVCAPVEGPKRAAPNFPGRPRAAQAFEKPCLLLGAKDGLGRLVATKVWEFGRAITNGLRGTALVPAASRVQYLEHLLRNEVGEIRALKDLGFGATARFS